MSKLSLYNLGVAMLVSIGTMASLPSPHSKQIRSHAFSVLLLRDFIIFRICWGSPYEVWANSPSKRPDEGIMAEAVPKMAEALSKTAEALPKTAEA